MGLLALMCFIIALLSVSYFISFITKIIKSKMNKSEYKFELEFPFDFYKKNPLVFLVVGLLIVLLTLLTLSPSIMAIIFPNNLRYKPEGTYCYYVIDKSNKAYPAKIEKTSYTENNGEDSFGNPTSETNIYVELLELFIDSESYEFYDDPQEINIEEFTKIRYYNEIESEDGEYEEVEKEFKLKLTNDVAYCPSFGKGTTQIDYLELTLEILVIVSEISIYIITIYVCTRKN